MRKNVIALGFFDGVHLGHQRILREAVSMAKKLDCTPAVLTFENQPRAFLTGKSPCLLTTNEQREAYIRSTGIEKVWMTHFDYGIAGTPPESFVRNILLEEYNCAGVVCGDNYSFGSMGKGNGELLKKMGGELGFECSVCEPVIMHDSTVSSTWIRSLVAEGRVREAAELMGHPYVIKGEIVHGRGVGSKIGFPTCNVKMSPDMLKPKYGVYAAYIDTEKGRLACALNVGVRPTFGLNETVAEFNIIDFSGDFYGNTVELVLTDFIREERAFANKEELSLQIAHDVSVIKELIK